MIPRDDTPPCDIPVMELVPFRLSADEWAALQHLAMARTWSFLYERDVARHEDHNEELYGHQGHLAGH